LRLTGNEISGNAAQGNYGGVYVDVDEARLEMENNLISANTAVTETGGLYLYGMGNGQYYVNYNQIVDNTNGMFGGVTIEDADDSFWGMFKSNLIAGNSGGVYLLDADFVSINDTIADNGGFGVMMTGTVTSTANLVNGIVWGHTNSFITTDPLILTFEASYSDIQGSWAGTGNINADPQFRSPGAGDYHLEAASPAVDAGTNVGAPPLDLDGLPRPYNGIVDMGAYEYGLRSVYLPLIRK
jgi:hypothetical protein